MVRRRVVRHSGRELRGDARRSVGENGEHDNAPFAVYVTVGTPA